MLFTDADFVSVADVATLDPEVLTVAAAEGIVTSGTGGFVHLAIEEAGSTLLANMQGFDYNRYGYGAISYVNQYYFGTLSDNTPPNRTTLSQIVVDSHYTTYTSPLKKWVMYLALRTFYAMASGRFVNANGGGDRYHTKMEQVEKDIQNKYWNDLKANGLPVVFSPVAVPGSTGLSNVGTWRSSNVTTVAGGMDAGGTFDVSITYTAQAESGPSATQTITVPADNQIVVNLDGLIPNPALPEDVAVSVQPVTSWNIYVGTTGGVQYLQGSVPIGTTTYTLGTPVLSGTPVGRGQARDTNLMFMNLFLRG